MKNTLIIASLIGLTFCACKKKEDPAPAITVVAPPVASGSDTLGEGTFTSYEHGLGGSVLLYKDTDSKILRLYNFNMTQGPDVHVYLSKTSSYSPANVIELTKLTSGYSNSSLNLPVTSASYSASYKYVLVYCVQYSSLFGYATLQ